MKTISKKDFQNLPSGIQESIFERSKIHAAISNAKTFIKYAKQCIKTSKDPDYSESSESWLKCAKNSLKPYYDKLIEVESLANKYSALWWDEFLKTKINCEKILNL